MLVLVAPTVILSSTPSAPDLSVREYLRPLWIRRYFVLAVVVLVTAGTFVFYDRQPDQYSSSTDVYLRSQSGADPITGAILPPTNPRDLANQARLLRTQVVAKRVAENIGYSGDPKTLLANVTVTPSTDADFVTVVATAGQAETAAALADAFAKAFIEQRDATQRATLVQARRAAQKQLDALPASLRDSPTAVELGNRVRQLKLLEGIPPAGATQLEQAQVPNAPFAPNPARNSVFALALSFLLAALAAYGLDRVNTRIRHVDGVSDLYGAPVLSVLPHVKAPGTGGDRKSAPSDGLMETFRTLRSAIDLARTAEETAQVLLVTSAVSDEGKSTVARNLATAQREAGLRVLLIEADLRRPSLASTMGINRGPGLTEVLTRRATIANSIQVVEVGLPGIDELSAARANGHGAERQAEEIHVLTAGEQTPNPSTLLATSRLADVVAELRGSYDALIIDSAPVVPVSDTLHLLSLVDGILIVTRVGRSTPDSASQMMSILDRYPHPVVLGIVANDVKISTYGYPTYAYSQT